MAAAARHPLQLQLEAAAKEFEKFEQEREKLELAYRKLTTQLTENKMVETELTKLEDGCEVYKLIGPVMMKQDSEEAKGNVGKRIDFINSELKRLDAQIKDYTSKMADKRKKIMEVQQQMQTMAQQAQLQARQQQALMQQAAAQQAAQQKAPADGAKKQ